MVVARSPSPISSRSSNPNPKILRKSGSFDLSKSCSDSEIPHRNSSSRFLIGNRSSFEQKENQQDPKYSNPARSKSPSINPSKIMKSFMAPTISASSKIVAASPSKKILAERNLVDREFTENNIVSSKEVKMEEIRQKIEIDYSSRSKKLDFSSSKGYEQSTQSLDVSASDAYPSLPPYDPMKNYLSPRPRFLHYKSNPRLEQNHEFMEDLLNVGEGRKLEDNFSYTDEESEDCSEYTEQSSSMKDDNLMNPQQVNVFDKDCVFYSNPRTINYKPKAWSFGKFKLIPFLLALSVLLFSVPFTDSPMLSASNIKDQSLADPLTNPFRIIQDIHLYDYIYVGSRNLQGLAIRMRQWLVDSIEIVISSCSFTKDELSMPHSFNRTLTSLMFQSSPTLDFCRSSDFEVVEKEIIVNRPNGLVDYMEIKIEVDMNDDSETLQSSGNDAADKFEVEFNEDLNGDSIDFVGWNIVENNGDSEYDQLDSLADPAVQFGTINNSDELEKIEITISEEIRGEGYPVGFDVSEKLDEQILIELKKDNVHPINNEEISFSTYSLDETQLANKTEFNVPSIFSDYKFLLLGMFVSIPFIAKLISFLIKKKNSIHSFNEETSNKKTRSVYGGTKSRKHANGNFDCNRGELAEMVCDSDPTKISFSFDNNVTPSSEISLRRESGVSSSISYGSFTSFERCFRKGNKKNQVLTPVRRSSRLQNQAS